MAEGIVGDLVKVEKALLGAVGDLTGTAADAVAGTLKGAAEVLRNVIGTIGLTDDKD